MVLSSNTVLPTFILSIYIKLQTCWMPRALVICMANFWLEDQNQNHFYSGMWALEKCWTKCVSAGKKYAEMWQNTIWISFAESYQSKDFFTTLIHYTNCRAAYHLCVESHISLSYLEHGQLSKLTFNQFNLRGDALVAGVLLTLKSLKSFLL